MACLSSSSDGWTAAENKVFEDTLAEFQGIGPACMAVLAERLPSKTEAEVRDHYIELLVDIESIEKGTYPEPKYTDSEEEHKEEGLEDEDLDAEEMPEEVKPLSPVIPELNPRLIDMPSPLILDDEDATLNMYSPMSINAAKDELAAIVNGTALAASLIPRALEHGNVLRAAGVPQVGAGSNVSPPLPPAPLSTLPRRGSGRRFRDVSPPTKGVPWTKDEHRMFLIGMDVYGRGDWRSISKNFVQTRTPSQVASHAQKYFNRRAEKRERRRPSIHDITSASESSFALKLPASVYDIIKRNKLLFSPITNNAHQPAGPSLSSPSCSNRFPAIEFVPSATPNAMAEGNRAESFAPTQLPNSFREKTGYGNYSFAKDAAGLPYDSKCPGPWWAWNF